MRLRPTKLSTRLLLLVLTASMPGFVLLAVDAMLRRRAAAEDALMRASQLTSVIAATHESALASTEVLLAGLSALPAPNADEPMACRAFTERLAAIDPRVANFGAVKPDGTLLCSAHPVPGTTTLAGRAWLTEAVRTRGFVMGDHLIGSILGRPVAVVSYPILTRDSVTAVLFASIDLAALTRLAARSSLPPATTLIIIDETGLVLARHPDPEPWVGRRLPDEPLVAAMRAGAGTFATEGVDGVPRFFAFRPLPGADVGMSASVAVGIPRSTTLAEGNAALQRSVLGMLVAALLALVLSNIAAGRLILRRTEALVEAADRLRSGDLQARSGLRSGPDEFGRLAAAFDAMAETVEGQTAELHRSREEMRLLARRTEEQVERERRRIARSVHDELGQAVTALKMDTAWLGKRLPEDPALHERIKEMARLLDETSRTVRRVSTELRPSILDDLGLDAAVEWQVHDFSRRTGIAGEVVLRVERNGLHPAVTTALFRILQEALTNVARHAHASRVVVQLTESAHTALLEVRDDGRGLPSRDGKQEPSLGVLGMRERAQALGGDVVVRSVKPHGTLVRAEIPLRSYTAHGL